jgi:hypothetical protein
MDRSMSRHNYLYHTRAHTPTHLVNIGVWIHDDYHVPFLIFSKYNLSLHTLGHRYVRFEYGLISLRCISVHSTTVYVYHLSGCITSVDPCSARDTGSWHT